MSGFEALRVSDAFLGSVLPLSPFISFFSRDPRFCGFSLDADCAMRDPPVLDPFRATLLASKSLPVQLQSVFASCERFSAFDMLSEACLRSCRNADSRRLLPVCLHSMERVKRHGFVWIFKTQLLCGTVCNLCMPLPLSGCARACVF